MTPNICKWLYALYVYSMAVFIFIFFNLISDPQFARPPLLKANAFSKYSTAAHFRSTASITRQQRTLKTPGLDFPCPLPILRSPPQHSLTKSDNKIKMTHLKLHIHYLRKPLLDTGCTKSSLQPPERDTWEYGAVFGVHLVDRNN